MPPDKVDLIEQSESILDNIAAIITRYELLNMRNEHLVKLRHMANGFHDGQIHESAVEEIEDENVDFYCMFMYTLD